jgi:hypothetical protein
VSEERFGNWEREAAEKERNEKLYGKLDIDTRDAIIKALQAQVVKLRGHLISLREEASHITNGPGQGGWMLFESIDEALAEPTSADVERIDLALKIARSVEITKKYGGLLQSELDSVHGDNQAAANLRQFQALDNQGRQV